MYNLSDYVPVPPGGKSIPFEFPRLIAIIFVRQESTCCTIPQHLLDKINLTAALATMPFMRLCLKVTLSCNSSPHGALHHCRSYTMVLRD